MVHNEPMQFLSFTAALTILFGILSGCSFIPTQRPSVPGVSKSHTEAPESRVEAPAELKSGALWELLSGEKVSLQLKNVDNRSNLTVIIEKGISKRVVPTGHWELTGFEENGVSYVSMNTTKKFVFRMTANKNVYAGSIVIGCPRIAAPDFLFLEQLKFFYSNKFSSSSGLCEMVVGNDYAGVNSSYLKTRKNKKSKLILGF
jgi:hypothetical protein